MNRILIARSILTLALIMTVGVVVPAPGWGAVLLERDFRSLDSEQVGVMVPTEKGGGWKSGIEDDDPTAEDYLRFSVRGNVLPEAGTIEIQLLRENIIPNESLFGFTDAAGSPLEVAIIFWGGFTQKQFPEIKIEGKHPRRLWYNQVSKPYVADYALESIPFNKSVAAGQGIHLAFTWGPGEGECGVYLDMVKLSSSCDVPFGMAELVEGSSEMVFGAEPGKEGVGGFDFINSPIETIRIHDKAIGPSEMGDPPTVSSVSHDAFSVAGYSGKLIAGNVLSVTAKGDPGMKASFDLVEMKKAGEESVKVADVPMAEDPKAPGSYAGTYTVPWGASLNQGLVKARLTNSFGRRGEPVAAPSPLDIDGIAHMIVNASNDLVPANQSARSGLTVKAVDANGKAIRDHQLKLTMSTTDEYTGIVGGSSFEDAVGGTLDVDWGGVTDSFGEVTAQLISGFAAKTMMVSAKDMVSGDVGVGWVRSYIEGAVEIVVKPARTSALSFAGSMELSASRDWLTADGRSRSRITAVVKDAAGVPMEGHVISFSLVGSNGSIRAIQSKTDARGRAFADYVAGTKMGQVTIEVRDTTGGLFGSITIELRPDAPAKIALTADSAEVYVGGDGTTVTAEVMDINDNPNRNVDVVYDISVGEGSLSAASVATDEEGKASVQFIPGSSPGTVTVRGTVTSRAPTAEEISAAQGAVFLYGLAEDPGDLEVTGWLVESGDEVVEGQDLATLEDRRGTIYTVKAPRDGEVSVFAAEEGDEVQYGDTLGYVLLVEEK